MLAKREDTLPIAKPMEELFQIHHLYIFNWDTSILEDAKNMNSINVKLCKSFFNFSKGKINHQSYHILRQLLDLASVTK